MHEKRVKLRKVIWVKRLQRPNRAQEVLDDALFHSASTLVLKLRNVGSKKM